MKNLSIAMVAACALALAACAGSKQASSSQSSSSSSGGASPVTSAYRVVLDTTKGPVTIEIDPKLAPNGAQHFSELVKAGYFNGARFYRVVPGFVVQWGYASDPAVSKQWNVPIADDPVKASNSRGMVSFAATGRANSRTTHLFINLGNNARLDAFGFAPIGRVTSGMSVVDHIYSGYGEHPDQGQIADQGNAYLDKNYPHLDYIKSAQVVEGNP